VYACSIIRDRACFAPLMTCIRSTNTPDGTAITEQDVSQALKPCLEEEAEAPWVPYVASQVPDLVAGHQGPDGSGDKDDVRNAQNLMHHITRHLHETRSNQAEVLAGQGDDSPDVDMVLNLLQDPAFEQTRNRIRREQVRLSRCAAA
jgi:hypothetical protein